jgi:hypothetical protein
MTDAAGISRAPDAPDGRFLPVGRLQAAGSLALILGVTALTLRLVDMVPAVVTGSARGVRHYASIAELEHTIGSLIPVPAFFPDVLQWPPIDIRAFGVSAWILTFGRRDTSEPWLRLGMRVGDGAALPSELLPEDVVLQTGVVQVGDRPAILRRLHGGDGTTWNELAWHSAGRLILMRYRGPEEELRLMASSVEGRQP